MTYEFFSDWHIGDCLLQCLYFQRVAPMCPQHSFIFYCNHHDQLQETVEHLSNVALKPASERPPHAINAWIGEDRCYHNSPIRNDYLRFYIFWFEHISKKAGLYSPFKKPDDFIFDYPALLKPTPLSSQDFDFLVVNSAPKSCQYPYDEKEMDALIGMLVAKGYRVVVTQASKVPGVECTAAHGLTITGVGNVSMRCKYHICINTGPSWPTYNRWNAKTTRLRFVLHESIVLTYTAFDCHSFRYTDAVIAGLKAIHLL